VQFQNNFDFGEFLAYLLPGALLFFAFNLLFGRSVDLLSSGETDLLQSYGSVLGIIFVVAISIAAGHLCSVWTRWVLRPLAWRLGGNPRLDILKSSSAFYSGEFRRRLALKFSEVVGVSMLDAEIAPAVPRLIRSHVLNKMPATFILRERHVRARGLCGNLSAPLLIFFLIFLAQGQCLLALATLLGTCALFVKQQDLDVREWKEIYTAFLTI
jgi:hypothetical protein